MPGVDVPLNNPPQPLPASPEPLPVDHRVATNGRLRCSSVLPEDRNIAIGTHLSLLSALVLGPLAFLLPLVFWICNKDRSPYRADHCAEALNVAITGAILSIVVGMIWWLVIPAIAFAAWLIVALIAMIRASMAASNGEYFRYPMTIRFLS